MRLNKGYNRTFHLSVLAGRKQLDLASLNEKVQVTCIHFSRHNSPKCGETLANPRRKLSSSDPKARPFLQEPVLRTPVRSIQELTRLILVFNVLRRLNLKFEKAKSDLAKGIRLCYTYLTNCCNWNLLSGSSSYWSCKSTRAAIPHL